VRCGAAQGLALLRDLLAIEVPITLNEAFCEYQLARCPPSEQLTAECDKVRAARCTHARPHMAC
jgi:hypothetical protein